LLSPDTLLSPTKGGALSRAHGRPTIIIPSILVNALIEGGVVVVVVRVEEVVDVELKAVASVAFIIIVFFCRVLRAFTFISIFYLAE